jgi:hypothetical protein
MTRILLNCSLGKSSVTHPIALVLVVVIVIESAIAGKYPSPPNPPIHSVRAD